MRTSVVLVGEGSNELGGWYERDHAKRDPSRPGVLQALLAREGLTHFEVVDAAPWRHVPLYRAGEHRNLEQRRVIGIVLWASERAHLLVFSRDQDGDSERERYVAEGLNSARTLVAAMPRVVGGVAIERLESWVLAALGVPRTEAMDDRTVDAELEGLGVKPKDGVAMVNVIGNHPDRTIPQDATSLRTWLDQAHAALGRS